MEVKTYQSINQSVISCPAYRASVAIPETIACLPANLKLYLIPVL